jgi:hypothetical protein
MPHDRKSSTLPPARSMRRSAALAGNVLRFPTRRRRAYPRPDAMPPLHPALLQRMVEVYFALCDAIGHADACRRVEALGWRRGLAEHLAPAIDRENARLMGMDEA